MATLDVSIDALKAQFEQINDIDQKLAAASGAASAGKRSILNRAVSDQQDTSGPVVANFVAELENSNFEIETLAGVVYGIIKGLEDSYKDQIDAWLDEQAKELEESAEDISDNERDELVAEAKKLRQVYTAMRNMLEIMGEDVSSVPEPKRLTGARGARGPRMKKRYNYTFDGKPRSDSMNNISSIFATECGDIEGWTGTKDLKEFMANNKFDFDNPPDNYEVTLPNGKVLSMVVDTVEESYEGEGDESDED